MEELSLEQIQKFSFLTLKKLVELISNLGLRYSLAWGTLLGAVRHQGFIPWDDDVDIMMPRPDYEQLIDYCKNHRKELLPFELHNIKTNPNYVYVLSRFSDSRFKIDYDNVMDYGLGIFVDIYPVDGLGNTYEEAKNNNTRNAKKRRLAKLLEPGHFLKSESGLHKTIFKYPAYILARLMGRERLLKTIDSSCASIPYNASSFVGIPTVEIEDKYIFKKDIFEEFVDIQFAGEIFKSISHYKEYLTQRYGDYMKLPPVEERIAHHFYSARIRDVDMKDELLKLIEDN